MSNNKIQFLPLNKDFLDYLDAKKGKTQKNFTKDGHPLVGVPPTIKRPELKTSLERASYPTSYDLRTLGRVTPVKNQGFYGTCNCFATYGSLESCLMPEERDFSENNLANNHGFSLGFDEGGNSQMSTAYLSRWSGPINESDDPYPNPDFHPGSLPVQKHVQEVLYIPIRNGPLDNDVIKEAIMNHGGIYAVIWYDDEYYNSSTYSFYNDDGQVGVLHAITIVGWDDNYSPLNFNVPYPAGPGAFIAKNSWGTSWGEGGYFYISYYDESFEAEAVFNNAESVDNYEDVYQYDYLGAVAYMGFFSRNIWMANVFTACSNPLTAVSFYTFHPDTEYEISVYTGITDEPTSGTLAGKESGIIPMISYTTIPLNSLIPLKSGEKFSVVIKQTSPPNTTNWGAVEARISGYSDAATGNYGESYISPNGIDWTDIYNVNTGFFIAINTCIKAFTKKSEIPSIYRGIPIL